MSHPAGLHPRQCVDYEMMIGDAYPGTQCRRFEVFHYPDFATHWSFNIGGPAEVLIRHGLIDPAVLASLPACGTASRGGLYINRGKTRVRLAAYFRSDDDYKESEEASRKLEAQILKAILPAVWSPKSPA